eukprot:768629-Hanusia_phi.AAC.9
MGGGKKIVSLVVASLAAACQTSSERGYTRERRSHLHSALHRLSLRGGVSLSPTASHVSPAMDERVSFETSDVEMYMQQLLSCGNDGKSANSVYHGALARMRSKYERCSRAREPVELAADEREEGDYITWNMSYGESSFADEDLECGATERGDAAMAQGIGERELGLAAASEGRGSRGREGGDADSEDELNVCCVSCSGTAHETLASVMEGLDNGVVCVGSNRGGKLGIPCTNSSSSSSSPLSCTCSHVLNFPHSAIRTVSSGSAHTLMLVAADSRLLVYGAGDNCCGQLGMTEEEEKNLLEQEEEEEEGGGEQEQLEWRTRRSRGFVQIKSLSDRTWSRVACGSRHSALVDSHGNLHRRKHMVAAREVSLLLRRQRGCGTSSDRVHGCQGDDGEKRRCRVRGGGGGGEGKGRER